MRHVMRHVSVIVGGGAMLLVCAPALAATCQQAKLSAAGRKAASALVCYAKAVSAEGAVDAECLDRAASVFVAAFAKAEQRTECATLGDAATVARTVDGCVAGLTSQLDATSPPTRTEPCVVAKLRAVGKVLKAEIKCHVRQSGNGGAADQACLDRAERSLSSAFAKAELRGDCATTGDMNAVGSTVDGCLTDILDDLPSPATTTTPVTTTTSTTALSGCGGTEPSTLSGITAAHNAVRAGASPAPSPPLAPLCWNASVASGAQAWANACSWRHNPNLSNLGENIAALGGDESAGGWRVALALWADEAANYDYANNACSGVCGHYTQLVWRSTTQVGCGLKVCTTGSPFGPRGSTWTMIVCDYRPPGNFNGQRPY